jgi:hypothetical protein
LRRFFVGEHLVIAGIVFATVIVLFPIFSVSIPPILDYPNHYARLWLHSGGANDPVLSTIYRIDWSLTWINVFIDMVASLLGPLVGVQIVSLIVLSLGLLLPPLGIALLGQSLFGTYSWWSIVCFLLCWNWMFLAGFINFEVGLGLALVAAALELQIVQRLGSTAFAARFIIALAIIVVHPFGALFYLALLIGLAFGMRFEDFLSRKTLVGAIARAISRGWPVILAFAVILIFGPKLPGASRENAIIWNEWNLKSLVALFSTYFRTYNIIYDMLVAILFVSIVGAAALYGRLRYHAGLLSVSLALGLISLFIPKEIMATSGISPRLPSMMVLAMAACLRPELRGTTVANSVAVGAALVMILLRTAYIATVWDAAERDLAAVRRAVASVEPGSAILPVEYEISPVNRSIAPMGRLLGGTTPNFWHYPALAVVDRKAFIPWLFSAPGKQPLKVIAPWNEISADEGQPPSAGVLFTTTAGLLKNWRSRFDYVLLLNADMDSNGPNIDLVPELSLVTDQGFARLYRILRRPKRSDSMYNDIVLSADPEILTHFHISPPVNVKLSFGSSLQDH